MQKIVNFQVLMHLLTHDTAPEHRQPGGVHARRAGASRPVGKQAAADEQLVPPLLTAPVTLKWSSSSKWASSSIRSRESKRSNALQVLSRERESGNASLRAA